MKNESKTGNSQRVMRAARLLVLSASVIGFIGATVSPAAASWQGTTFKGTPGEVILINYRAAEGGICGDTTPGVIDPSNCTQNFNWIFVDRFWVSTAPYSVFQTIRVDAYLYQYNFQSNIWTLAIAFPHTEISPSSIRPFSNLGWNFGSPASDVASCIPLGCTPAFVRIPKGGGSYTVVVKIFWLDSSTGNVLAQANYIPGTDWVYDIGCAKYAEFSTPTRCTHNIRFVGAYALGLPSNQLSVGYLTFP